MVQCTIEQNKLRLTKKVDMIVTNAYLNVGLSAFWSFELSLYKVGKNFCVSEEVAF